MTETRTDDALSNLLRAGDPAAEDPGLDATERALMRQRILVVGREGRRQATGWLLPAAATMALLALGLGLALLQPRAPLPDGLARTGGATAPAISSVAAAGGGQQIQFTTDNGILVVWVLQPKHTS